MAKRGRKSIANERRGQILDAFHICAVRNGLEKASLREVAEEVGLPVSNLHHFFKNRDEMVSELVKRNMSMVMNDLRAELQDDSDPRRRFRKSIDFLFGPKAQHLEDGSLHYDFWSLAHRSETVRRTYRDQVQGQRGAIVKGLTETPELMELSRADMKEIANVLIALVEGTFYIRDMDGENVSLARMARLTRRFLELYAEEKIRGKKL
ncbi:MAG: TetR/AcrR family transcriptional regulator [Candidatus Abyssobacteria bacterium SURF_17]|jgi:AcrR family transcriptional regulator|uniref:TetR/AcrR family transcriptional regulator n=1 Tax=Candidatus Abyssobacteria bacterium SURF_17 TaxID=2093361 RepID=A0A419F2B9_9BACT|nr:MAG: TetR/AcrR family transcriptional regulator [Candidatus Abyssubacteria bacterium SURF_17]